MTTSMHRPHISDAYLAAEYWKDKEWKKWAVDITSGHVRKPTFSRTEYVRARTSEDAIACIKRESFLAAPPRGSRYAARLAGPYELGCRPT